MKENKYPEMKKKIATPLRENSFMAEETSCEIAEKEEGASQQCAVTIIIAAKNFADVNIYRYLLLIGILYPSRLFSWK